MMAILPLKKLKPEINTSRDLINSYDKIIFKLIFSIGIVIYFCYIPFLIQPSNNKLHHLISCDHSENKSKSNSAVATTDVSHLVFGVASSLDSWRDRRPFIERWWLPNQTRGAVWLDREPTGEPWPDTLPPFQVSEDISKFQNYQGIPYLIRLTRVILETFNMNFTNARWFVMADDDTVFIVKNLVEVLQRYDHQKYYYIGGLSECVGQTTRHSFGMAFGGAGYAMSYPLVRDLSRILDGCIMRYPFLSTSDHILQSCLAELGVHLTTLPGFHQFDLHGDVSGFLSAHPPAPVLSFHHINSIHPIFPSMTQDAALGHLMEAANADHSRILQQTVCYNRRRNMSFSVSWGYSVHIYERLHPPGFLHTPIQTFVPWNSYGNPPFLFNVRPVSDDPCLAPHIFFFERIKQTNRSDHITVSYARNAVRGLLAACANNSADSISRIVVSSPIKPFKLDEGRRECCKVTQKNSNVAKIKIRSCLEGEASDWTSLS